MGRSVFAVSRSIWDDPDFASERYTEREAWMWLVSAAIWKDGRTRGNSGPIELKRGEFSFSVRFLAQKWKWNKDKAHRFVKRLQKCDMVRDTSRDGAQIYSIKNYRHFQVVGLPKRDSDQDSPGDASETTARQQRDKEETGKQDNRINTMSGSPPATSDVVPIADADFEVFWRAYQPPPNSKKPDARKAWKQTAAERPQQEALLRAVAAYNAWLSEQSRTAEHLECLKVFVNFIGSSSKRFHLNDSVIVFQNSWIVHQEIRLFVANSKLLQGAMRSFIDFAIEDVTTALWPAAAHLMIKFIAVNALPAHWIATVDWKQEI